jgi:excisionase family DNA binding protein
MSNPDPQQMLTSEEVMERLLSDAHLKRLALTCVLPAVRCGDEWRFRRSDLEAWIERQQRAPRRSVRMKVL